MFIKRILPIVIIVLVVIFGYWRFKNPCVEHVNQTLRHDWSGQNPFSIKIERKPDICNSGIFKSLAGANYVFQSSVGKTENWQEIMTFTHDDPVDIKNENIEIFNDHIAYVYMGWKYAVTADGGKTWNVWDAKKDLPDSRCYGYELIRTVKLNEDGNGLMVLNPVPKQGCEILLLQTTDFGRTWNP